MGANKIPDSDTKQTAVVHPSVGRLDGWLVGGWMRALILAVVIRDDPIIVNVPIPFRPVGSKQESIPEN